jgi:hypothetical protein
MEGAASSAPKFLKSHVASAMTGESDIGRKHLAHPAIIERHNEAVIIYLTVCSKDRKSVFASKDSAAVVVDAWQKANLWLVGRYVFMPDHIHLFCAPNRFPVTPLKQWLKYWKILLPSVGRGRRIILFGSAIFGTHNYGVRRATILNGNT